MSHAHASEPRPVADSSPIRIKAPAGQGLSVTVAFYSDQRGTVRLPPAGGSRALTIQRVDRLRLEDADVDTETMSEIPGVPLVVVDGVWHSETVGGNAAELDIRAVPVSTPPDAAVYRLFYLPTDVEKIVTRTADLTLDVIDGQGTHPAFGARNGIPIATTTAVWSGTALERPLPLAPKPMFVVSSSAADSFGVSGAQLALVTFIDENGDWRNSDLLIMNGTTNVPITYKPSDGLLGNASNMPRTPSPPNLTSQIANILRIQDESIVVAVGATELNPRVSNLGVIRVRDGAGVVFEHMPIGAGRSRSASFCVPRGYTGRLKNAPVGVVKGACKAYISTTFGPGTSWQTLPIAAVDASSVLFQADAATTPISELADVQVVVTADTNAIDVIALMQLRLVPKG